MTERDTHFRNAAHFLLQEMDKRRLIADDTSLQHEEMQTLIAQFAYDLLIHDRLNTGTSDLQHAASQLEAEEMVNGIPDLTSWPEQT